MITDYYEQEEAERQARRAERQAFQEYAEIVQCQDSSQESVDEAHNDWQRAATVERRIREDALY